MAPDRLPACPSARACAGDGSSLEEILGSWLAGAGVLDAAAGVRVEAATGATWGQGDFSFENFVLGPFFKQEAVELARDAMTFTN